MVLLQSEGERKTYVVTEDVLFGADFDRIGDEAKDGTDPQQHGKAAKEVLAEFHPFGRRLRRRQGIGTVAFKDGLGLRCSQALIHTKSNTSSSKTI